MQKTGIVIPCYNEAQRLKLSRFKLFMDNNQEVEFLFVNDGSNDATSDILNTFQSQNATQVSVLNLNSNVGKAEAVRLGMLQLFNTNKYLYVGFWDADLATPLEEINHLLAYINNTKKIVLASRMKRMGADVDRRAIRHLLGRVFSTFASIILKLPVYDTQCGAKLFHQSLFHLFKDKFYTKWLFDIELLARHRNKYGKQTTCSDTVEVPVNSWQEVGGSKLKLSHILKVPFELIKIYRKYNYG